MRHLVATGLYERRLGVRTEGDLELAELGLDHPDRNGYQPVEWRALRRVLGPKDVTAQDVFVDFGAGMGRAVILAARLPIERAEGVELSEKLVRLARANVERTRGRRRCRDVRIVHADALTYDLPDDVTIAFFNNPFTGDVFAGVLERLIASHDRRPRRLRLIYRTPTEHEMIVGTGRFRLVRQEDNDGESSRINVYEALLPAR